MKISEQWLREWVNPQISTETLTHQLTMSGLEVDSVEPVASDFTQVVVGEIIAAEPHPNADKLRVCRVDIGDVEPLQIVCGAPNARQGLKAPVAKVGGKLTAEDGSTFKIRKAKLRSVESYGMLCSRNELGVAGDSSGLWELADDAPVGQSVREYLSLDDKIIEIDLTPNRADCLSVQGIAREVALLNTMPFIAPETNTARVDQETIAPPVEVLADDACPRYVTRILRNVDVTASTPMWMIEKLERSGIRSIDPIVDVTNYVMIELGQPMHAFDWANIDHGIRVRFADHGEVLTLLDGKEITLAEDLLVIADHSQPLALAGIMGGVGSGINGNTTDLLLESAYFDPISIAGKARSLGLHTDASHRYERGVDPELQHQAIERATELLLSIVGGSAGPIVDTKPNATKKQPICVRLQRINDVIGMAFSTTEVETIFTGLGAEILSCEANTWELRSPSWRFDLNSEIDYVEEVARVHGYDNLPETVYNASASVATKPEQMRDIGSIKRLLVNRGFNEAITYSFIDPELAALFSADAPNVTRVINPISTEMSVMRQSLIPGLANTAARNLSRQQSQIKLFETGLSFQGENGVKQQALVAGVLGGPNFSERWSNSRERADFFDAKNLVESLFAESDSTPEYRPCSTNNAFHPGQCAEVYVGGQVAGIVGALHPTLLKKLSIDLDLFAFELNASCLLNAQIPHFSPLDRYPEMRRDIAILVDRNVPAADLENAIFKASNELLRSIKIFDIYVGQGIDSTQKSVGLGLTFRDSSRTLGEQEVSDCVQRIVQQLNKSFAAELR